LTSVLQLGTVLNEVHKGSMPKKDFFDYTISEDEQAQVNTLITQVDGLLSKDEGNVSNKVIESLETEIKLRLLKMYRRTQSSGTGLFEVLEGEAKARLVELGEILNILGQYPAASALLYIIDELTELGAKNKQIKEMDQTRS